MPTKIQKKKDAIIVSYEHYDLTFVSADFRLGFKEIYNCALKNLKKVELVNYSRCPRVIDFFGHSSVTMINNTCVKTIGENKFCAIKSDKKNMWIYPYKILDCPNEILPNRDTVNSSFCFGKFDFAIFTSYSHYYWSCYARSLYANEHGYKDFINIPCYRLKWKKSIVEANNIVDEYGDLVPNKIKDEKEIDFVEKYILFVFIKAKNDLDRGKLLLEYKQWALDTIENGINGLGKKEKGNRFEFLLTLSSSYPFVIKIEASSFEEVNRVISYVRNKKSIVEDTSTVMTINANKFLEKEKEEIEEDLITIGLLVNVVSGYDAYVILKIRLLLIGFLSKEKKWKDELSKLCGEEININKNIKNYMKAIKILLQGTQDENIEYKSQKDYFVGHGVACEFHEAIKKIIAAKARGYYWDIFVSFATKRPKELLELIVKMRKDKAIVNLVTIPYWEENIDVMHLRVPEKKKKEKGSRKKWNKADIADYMINVQPVSANSKWKRIGSFKPTMTEAKIYEMKFDLEWLYNYCRQLHHAWRHKEELFFADTKTFRKIEDELLYLIEYTQTASEKVAVINKEITDNEDTEDQDLSEITRELNYLWNNDLDEIKSRMDHIKELLSAITIYYNEQLEASQVVTMTDPLIRFGSRAGVMDMVEPSIAILFKDFIGSPNENEMSKTVHDKFVWNGIVVSSGKREYMYSLYSDVLHLPVQFRFHVHEKLHLIAHEAAHFLLKELFETKCKEKMRKEFNELWTKIFAAACVEIEKFVESKEIILIEKDLVRFLIDIKKSMRIKSEMSHESEILRKTSYRDSFSDYEIICDLIATLIAGPAFTQSLLNSHYQKSTLQSEMGLIGNYLPMWMRILLGRKIISVIRWNGEKKGKSKMQRELSKMIRTSDNRFRYIMEVFEQENDRLLLSSLLGKKDGNKKLLESEDCEEIIPLLTDQYFILMGLMRNEKIIYEIAVWLDKYFPEALFTKVDKEFEFDSDEWKNAQEKIALKKYGEVTKVAARLIENSEVVTDVRPKTVACATIMKNFERPVYPSARLLHSFYYYSRKD